MTRILTGLALAAQLCGCATIIDGTSEQLAFDSNPPGADCNLVRKGLTLATVKTPGTVTVQKTKDDIQVKCSKDGYDDSTAYLKSNIQDATWGNIVAGGGIGWAVDSATGSDNKYEEHTTVTLAPKPATPSPTAAIGNQKPIS